MKSRPRQILLGLLILYAAFLVYSVFADTETYQWDFRTYYYAAQADAQGLNPYDPVSVHRLDGGKYRLQFVYPPHALILFRPLTALSYETAANLWLVLKLLLAVGLVLIWKRRLFPREPADLFFLFMLFAFSATIYLDLVTGNVSLIEQFLLWFGVVFLLRRQLAPFCILVICAAAFKLSLIVFLSILVFTEAEHKWRYLALSTAAFASLLLTGYWLDPAGYQRFFAAATAITERGAMGNPSSFALIADTLGLIAGKGSALAGLPVAGTIYLALVLLILVSSFKNLRKLRRAGGPDKEKIAVFFFCLLYALIAPRFKTYSFILILPAAYYVLSRSAQFKVFGFLIALLILTIHPPLPAVLPIRPLLSLFWTYYPLGLAFLVWGLLIALIRADAKRAMSPSRSS